MTEIRPVSGGDGVQLPLSASTVVTNKGVAPLAVYRTIETPAPKPTLWQRFKAFLLIEELPAGSSESVMVGALAPGETRTYRQ